jgi:AraC-like DNA-binding protein
MTGGLLLIDTLLRGMNVGAAALLALALLSQWPVSWRRGLGAAFIVATACYIVHTSAPLDEALGPLVAPIRVLSIIAPVIFWQFALALFDDNFRLRPIALLPLLLLLPMVACHFFKPSELVWTIASGVARATMVAAYAHAMFTALRFLNDDLIEGRRRFRVVFAVAVAITGFIINFAESIAVRGAAPPWAMLVQSSGILFLFLGFGVWLLGMRATVLDGTDDRKAAAFSEAPAPQAPALKPSDRPAYNRLMTLMGEGVWREEGLSVAALAEKVGVPEHQLRALINGQLGHRNFSAFLNSYRLPAAQALLADPTEAKKQILQIALEVGFGSIAPFNRAFKEATGETPTDFRRRRLGQG